ncbi:MAG: helix-turn-helix transcriptional regulator [Spirochaetota bacterium]
MDTHQLKGCFQDIPNPDDYFQGKGFLRFSVPEQILVFYRGTYDDAHLGTDFDSHYRHVLIFNFSHPVPVFVDGTVIRLHRDQGLLLFPHQYHRFMLEEATDISLGFVTFSMSRSAALEHLRLSPFACTAEIGAMLKTLAETYKHGRERLLPFYTGLLISHISQEAHETALPMMSESSTTKTLMSNIFQGVYHRRHSSIQSLATDLGYSESYLRSHFKQSMGIPLGRFITEVRLTEAMRMLANTDAQVTSIADHCGYESVYSFSRAFRNHVGIAPSAYRYKLQVLKEPGESYRFRVSAHPSRLK